MSFIGLFFCFSIVLLSNSISYISILVSGNSIYMPMLLLFSIYLSASMNHVEYNHYYGIMYELSMISYLL